MAELEKTVEIDGKKVRFRASGATPRIYRRLYGRDIYVDINAINSDIQANGNPSGASALSVSTLQIFEDLTYCMAKQADPDIPEADEWFDQFSVFGVYDVMEDIMQLWARNVETMSQAKKKPAQPRAK